MSNGSNTIEEDYRQLERVDADARRLGSIPQGAFAQVLDNSVVHAAQTVAADSQADNRRWRNLGPRNIGGRIRALAIHPRDGRILYAGSALGGVWKTTDAGDSWRALDDFRPPARVGQALPVGAMAVAHSRPETLYVGTGEPTSGYISGSGLYWSENGGAVFNLIDHVNTGVIQAQRYERIRVDPWEPRRLWCATPDRGLWRGSPGNPPTFTQDVVDAVGAPAAGAQLATDVLLGTGDPRLTPPAKITVFVALQGAGVYRAVFDRANNRYDLVGGVAWSQVVIPGLAALPGFHRVKLAHCETAQNRMYCVAGIQGGANNNRMSNIFVSLNGGGVWAATGGQPGDTSAITWYALVLECSPTDPRVVFVGQVDLWRSTDGGASWGAPAGAPPPNFNPSLNWLQYSQGDRAQHADQHAVVFDRDRSRVAWVGNDGGVSMTPDLGGRWRKRSHGILATQFTDLASNSTFPFMCGGGLQDNGTWMTYGGTSWLAIGGGDGGDMGFEPGNPRLFHFTTQSGVSRAQMVTPLGAPGPQQRNFAPDLPPALLTGGFLPVQSQRLTNAAQGFLPADLPPASNGLVFYAVLSHHPTQANHALVGRVVNCYVTTDGLTFNPVGHAAPTAHGGGTAEITAVAYGANPNNDWWLGTSHGEIFVTANAGGAWRNSTEPLASRGTWISAIATHPTNAAMAAIAVASNPGTIYLTGDGGANWLEVSGRAGVGGANWNPRPAAGASDQFNPGPATALCFDPASPNAPAAQTLYVGSLTGVYVIRNALAPTAAAPAPAFQPVWRTLNSNLPLALIYDMEAITFSDAVGNNHARLRVATHGRGMYEADLGALPGVRLLIRRHIDDHGMALPAANTMATEPRAAAGPPPPPALVNTAALDIRVDPPPYRYLDPIIDSVEFDEELVPEDATAGELNLVYVQVHNTGALPAGSTSVSLYSADATGPPVAAPNLPADFWTGFPQAAPAPWVLLGTIALARSLVSGEPQVLRFQWRVPGTQVGTVALLALASDGHDSLVASPPATNITTLVGAERRAALRLVTLNPSPGDARVRDGLDDSGLLGETAWGARSHDIVVRQAVEATPDATFADTSDSRAGDVLQGSSSNQIYIRVHNRGANLLNNVQVNLFNVPLISLADPGTWQLLGTVVIPSVPGRSALFAPVIPWVNPPNPAAAVGHVLAALIAGDGDPVPDHLTRVSSVSEFWGLFLQALDSGNAALRALRWQP